MSQTTDGTTFRAAQVFVSADNSNWTDVSGHGASVAVSGGERTVGSQATFSGDTPIVSGGKRNATQVTVRYVYTETAAEPFEILRAIHEDPPGTIYLQYQVKTSGVWYKTGSGILENPGYPAGEAGSAETVMSEFVMSCAALTKEAAST